MVESLGGAADVTGNNGSQRFEIQLNSNDMPLVISEVSSFSALNGFINIHLFNEQFSDRVGTIISKRKVGKTDSLNNSFGQ